MGIFFEYFATDLLVLTGILIAGGYGFLIHTYSYWKRRGIKNIKPTLLVGNFGPTLFQKLSIGELLQNLYQQTSEKFIGIWAVTRPMLLINDAELVQNILIKDFQYFKDRGVYIDEENDPLSGHLFSLSGEKWKNLRAKLTPVFTSGKLKAMFSTLMDCGEGLQKAIDKSAANKEVIEVREISARYTTNVIASVAFGNDIDSFKDPDTSFRYYGRKAFALTFANGMRFFAQLIYPRAMQTFKMKSLDPEVEKFIFAMVKETLNYREDNNVTRKDLFQLLMQLKNQGSIQADDEWDGKVNGTNGTAVGTGKSAMTFNEMAAQVWVFWAAGFETSSTTLSFCIYELCKNLDVQRKLQEEIDETSARCNGHLTYEAINEMKYLDRCIEETLRYYPPVPFLNRVVTKAYKIPGTNTILEPGTSIIIPVLGLQRDEKFYENADVFDPDRFLLEEKSFAKRPWMPFGDGPRACIGTRLAKMQTKVGLALMLEKFSYELADSSKGKLVISPKLTIMAPIGGINVLVKRRNK